MIALTVLSHGLVSSRLVARTEAAITIEANRQVRRWWHTPLVAFRRAGGWRIDVVPLAHAERICGAPACHGVSSGKPVGLVGWVSSTSTLTILVSHEALEMAADPSARFTWREICDPVDGWWHSEHGVAVAAFVTPRGVMVNHPA